MNSGAERNEGPPILISILKPFYVAATSLSLSVIREFLTSATEFPGAVALRRDRGFATVCREATPEGSADVPAGSISGADAEILCAYFGGMVQRVLRLPTEAEWEYAARAGCLSAPQADPRRCSPLARHKLIPAQIRANAWGLIDMLGNGWEWTASEYGEMSEKRVSGSELARRGGSRALRGGTRHDVPLRFSRRKPMHVESRSEDVGVRLVCESPPL